MQHEPPNILNLLNEIRAIAQIGLNFTEGQYDRERYQRLLDVSATYYGKLTDTPELHIKELLLRDLGYITPKVSVDTAIFNRHKKILLTRRKDNGKWCLPGGWCEVTDTPKIAAAREVFEETGLTVKIGEFIDVFTTFPGQFGRAHTSYHMLYHGTYQKGRLRVSHETLSLGFFAPDEISDYNEGQLEFVERAYSYLEDLNGK